MENHNKKEIKSKIDLNNYKIDLSNNIITKAFSLFNNNYNKDNNKEILLALNLSTWDEFISKTEKIIWSNSVLNASFAEKKQLLLSLLDNIGNELNLSQEKQQDHNKSKEHLQKCLSLLKEIETQICAKNNYAYYTLPYFPLFLNISVNVFKACINTNIYNNTSPELVSFFNRMQIYIEDVIETAFRERRLQIVMHQVKNSRTVYLYDNHTKEDLTIRTAFREGIQFELIEAQEQLRDYIASNYMEILPINYISAALNMISGSQSFKLWSEYKERLIKPDLVKLLSTKDKPYIPPFNQDLLYTLMLPNIKQHFCESTVDTSKISSLFNLKDDPDTPIPNVEKEVSKEVLAETLKSIIKTVLKDISLAVMLDTPLAALAPILGGIIELLFPNTPPITREEMLAAINKAIEKALDQLIVNEINAKFNNCTASYFSRMEELRNKNKDVADKSKWDLGKPEDWDAAINILGDLEQYFFMQDYNFQYQTCEIFVPFATMYLTLIYSKLQTIPKGADVSVEKNMLDSFFTGWYNYLKKLANQAWNKTLDISDCQRIGCYDIPDHHSDNTTVYALSDTYNQKLYPNRKDLPNITYPTISDFSPDPSLLYYCMCMVETRFRLYATVNTNLRSMCAAYDVAVTKYNSMFNSKLPLATAAICDYQLGDSWYSKDMNYSHEKNTHFAFDSGDDGIHYSYGLPGTHDSLPDGRTNYVREDTFIQIGDDDPIWHKSTSDKYFPGDYICDIKKGTSLKIPKGYRVFFYSKYNYKGSCTIIPDGGDKSYNYQIPSDFKSMKVRLDFGYWFDNPYSKNYLRILNVKRDGDKVEDITPVVLPDNPENDPLQ